MGKTERGTVMGEGRGRSIQKERGKGGKIIPKMFSKTLKDHITFYLLTIITIHINLYFI